MELSDWLPKPKVRECEAVVGMSVDLTGFL
jgi:hypothetical protein